MQRLGSAADVAVCSIEGCRGLFTERKAKRQESSCSVLLLTLCLVSLKIANRTKFKTMVSYACATLPCCVAGRHSMPRFIPKACGAIAEISLHWQFVLGPSVIAQCSTGKVRARSMRRRARAAACCRNPVLRRDNQLSSCRFLGCTTAAARSPLSSLPPPLPPTSCLACPSQQRLPRSSTPPSHGGGAELP